MATNKQIYEYPNNPTPQLTDLIIQSNENNPSIPHETVQSTWQQLLNLFYSQIGISGIYLPVFTSIQGISSISVNNPHYDCLRNTSGNVVNVEMEMDITVDNSGLLARLLITNPIASGFTAKGQAQLMNFQIVPTINVGVNPGNTGCGWFNEFYSDAVTGNVFLGFEAAQTNVEYHITLAWKYQIQ